VSYAALRFDTEADAADAWADALLAAGALSVDLADPHAGTAEESPLYGEPGSTASEGWPVSRLTALFSDAAGMHAALTAIHGVGPWTADIYLVFCLGHPDIFPVGDLALRNAVAEFAPIRIVDRLWIVPSWCEAVDPAAINLSLDPGLAFGTGSHPTTRLCIRWLAHELHANESVLDYGCGSGILAIAALRLGAGRVVGTDIDPNALSASRDNARRNGVAATFVSPDELAAGECGPFDVVVANILANPLIVLAPALAARVRDGGRLVLSGILDAQAEAVIGVYSQWFNIGVCESDGGWAAVAGTRRGDAAIA